MIRYKLYLPFGLIFILLFSFCNKNQKDEEKTLLSEYLESHNIDAEPTNGIYILETGFSTSGASEALSPAEGDTTVIMYKGYLLTDSTIVFDEKSYDDPFCYVYLKDKVIPGWERAIGLMKENIPAKIIIPSDLAYKGNQTGIIPPYSTLIFDAKIIEIRKP